MPATLTTPATAPELPPPEPRRRTARHVVAIVAGSLAGLLAVVLLAGGAASLWANGQKHDDGYLWTDTERVAASTAALTTENVDVDLDGAGWLVDSGALGTIRLEAASRGDEPIFVGIAPTADVSAYLRGTAHAIVTDVDTSTFRTAWHANTRTVAGSRPVGDPTTQRFWAASSHGTGTQDLSWKVRDGDWSVVVMNADGAGRLDADVRAAAEAPFLTPLGWGLLGVGVVVLLASGALITVGVRGARRRPEDALPAFPLGPTGERTLA